eukprot:3727635-Karenia_brevis.AAC.1
MKGGSGLQSLPPFPLHPVHQVHCAENSKIVDFRDPYRTFVLGPPSLSSPGLPGSSWVTPDTRRP